MTEQDIHNEASKLLEDWRNGNKNQAYRALQSLSTSEALAVFSVMVLKAGVVEAVRMSDYLVVREAS
jgi:hypothetical protein